VHFIYEAAMDAAREDNAFSVTLMNGKVVAGTTTLLLAFGIIDILPELPGLADRWGKSMLHCPYCHGYEFKEKRLGVLNLPPMSVHQASLIPEWGPTTFFLNGGAMERDIAAELVQRGVSIEPASVESLVGEGATLSAIRLGDGGEQALDALFLSPRYRFSSDIAERLGSAVEIT
jgi:thioredoxin reductase